jgi:cyclopropane fatty-acyl-phospholipid synthase-like methyltransferase
VQDDRLESSFDAIYNAGLFHFFDGHRIRAGMLKFYRWLKPGGRLFLLRLKLDFMVRPPVGSF